MNRQTELDIASEAEFLAQLAASDERAWSALYRNYAPVLRKLAEHRGVSDSEDVIQEVMMRFFSALREERFGVGQSRNVGAYLVTLAKNLIIDAFRRDRARCRDVTISFDEFMLPMSATAPHIVEIREELALREEARQRMLTNWCGSERAKAIYVSCVINGRGVGEVAKELNMSPNTVSQIKRRGIQKARMLAVAAA